MNQKGLLHGATRAVIMTVALLALSACQPGGGQGGAEKVGAAGFYDGRNIRWIIPYSP